MKRKVVCLLILFGATISLNGQAPFEGCGSDNNTDKSVKKFITQYYGFYRTQNVEAVMKYYLKDLSKEDLTQLVYIMKRYKIDKVEIMKIEILIKNPMTVEVQIKEWYRQEVFPPPYQVVSYKLKSEDGLNWKIIETNEPGVP